MTKCPVCLSGGRRTRITVTTDQPYLVERCPHCGLAFTAPRPSPESLLEFYGEQYFGHAGESSEFGYSNYAGESWASINAARTWDDLNEWAPEVQHLSPRHLLDIGAAEGDFAARAASAGWTAVACEIGSSAREAAAAKGLETVASLDEARGPFGLITMFHVLEHLIDPLEALKRTRTIVAPGGYLAIELPQWRSSGRLVRGSRWSQLKPPEHINFFDRRSLAFALGQSGWSVVRSSTPYPRSGELALAAARSRKLREATGHAARFALGRLGLGGYLRVLARPN